MPAPAVARVPFADVDAHLRNCKTFSIAVAGVIFRVQRGRATVQPDESVGEYSMYLEHRMELDQAEFRAIVGRHAYTITLPCIGGDVRFEVRELAAIQLYDPPQKKDRKVLLCL